MDKAIFIKIDIIITKSHGTTIICCLITAKHNVQPIITNTVKIQ